MSTHFELGNFQQLPHYSVIGEPTKFYIHIRKRANDVATNERWCPKSSQWIVGQEAFELYNKLRQLYKQPSRAEFIALMEAKLVEYGGWFN